MTIKRTLIFLIILGLMTPVYSFAEEVKKPLYLSFEEALKMASERNVGVIVANKRVGQAIARMGQAASPLLPHASLTTSLYRKRVNLEAFGVPEPQPPQPPFTNKVFNVFDARISLTQTLFDPTAVTRLLASRAGKKLSRLEAVKARQDAMALVATLYLEAERAVETTYLATAYLKRDEERLRVIQERIQLGTASDLELKQAQADLFESKQRLRAAETERLSKRLDLAAALSLPVNQPIVFIREEKETESFALPEMSPPSDLQGIPDVAVARALVEQRKLERWAEVAEFFPKAYGSMDAGPSGPTPDDYQKTYSLGAQISLPLLEGGNKLFKMKEAGDRLAESKAQLQDTELQSEAKVISANDSLQQTKVLLLAKDAEMEVAKKQFDLAQHRLTTGLGSVLEVIEASAQEAFARDGKDEAIATYRMAEVNLARSMGRMESLIEEKKI